jgi:hypothetical protein
MGIETILMAASAVSAVSSVVGGIQGMSEGKNQANIAMAQAEARGAESARVAEREARLTQEDAIATERRQKLAYMASGVTLEGSPLLVMEETRRKGQENVDEILRAGQASSAAALAEGRLQADAAKSAGRQSFISGLTGAAGTGFNAYSALK